MAKTDASAAGLRPLYSFDQLVVGPHNHVAVASCLEVIKTPGDVYNPLFIYGPPGVGKTHLMQAVAHQILQQNPTFKVRYISAERFMSEILTAISEDRMLDVRRDYSTVDLLIIDDVQYMTESKISQEELFHVFNNMHQANRQVILAADRPPNQLTTLNKNIRSRLEWGLSTDVKIPDEATRIEILRKKQPQSMGLVMTDEMFAYVARSLKSNVRELEGFLKRIHAYITLSHQQMSMDLVRSVVREILPEGSSEPDMGSAVQLNASPPAAASNGRANGNHKPTAAPVEPAAVDKEPAAPAGSASFDLLLESIDMGTPRSSPPPFSQPVETSKAPPVVPPAVSAPPPPPAPVKPPPPPAPAPAPPVPEKKAPVPAPVLIEVPQIAEEVPEEEPDNSGLKEVGAVFFYPTGSTEALETVHRKFQEVIKKHKLKFRLKRAHSEPYTYKGKINYSSFVEVCKVNKVPVAIVIGPPPETVLPEQDFYDLLTVTLDVQGVSLQLVNWGEINKDYRYLNLALDIALVRSR